MGLVGRTNSWRELSLLYQPWNSWLNLSTLMLSICLAYSDMMSPSTKDGPTTVMRMLKFTTIASLCYFFCLLVFDVLYYKFGISIIDENETLRQGYNLGALLDDAGSATGDGLDYGFNYYNGNFKKTRRQAQIDKYEVCWEQLGLKEGMTVIDFGCGCGDWLAYLKSRGVEGIGINITEAQVNICHERGLPDVYLTDWKKIEGNPTLEYVFYGKADAVTMWDTIEHYVPAKCSIADEQDAIYTKLFQLVHKCLKPKSKVRKAWTSCLHYHTTKVSFSQHWNNYLLDKFHSGNYPDYHSRQLKRNASGLFVQSYERNLTEDYYMTSVLSPEHFGRHKFAWTPFRLVVFLATMLLDPNWLPRFIWFGSEAWMSQFTPDRLEDSPMQLLWIMWDCKT